MILLLLYFAECAHLLLAHNAPVKVKNAQGWSPLAEAISYGDRQMSKQYELLLLMYLLKIWSHAFEIFFIQFNLPWYEHLQLYINLHMNYLWLRNLNIGWYTERIEKSRLKLWIFFFCSILPYWCSLIFFLFIHNTGFKKNE